MSVKVTTKPLPGIFIPKEAVNERVKNFLATKHAVLSGAMGKTETRSAWYSLQQFEELVEEMRYQQADGLRIYFGAYSADDPMYGSQLTVIFVPTCLDETTRKHKDIILDNIEDFPERLAALDSKNLDTVGLCPPSCGDQDPLYPYES